MMIFVIKSYILNIVSFTRHTADNKLETVPERLATVLRVGSRGVYDFPYSKYAL